MNFVTAHDGFTLADATAYDRKHNQANGEGNRDGSDDNRSWNHGVEGRTDDAEIARRAGGARSRNLLGTLLLSAGVPMLLAGDEIGRTQHGNNNAYCQDDAIDLAGLGPRAVAAGPARDVAGTCSRCARSYPALRQRPVLPRPPGARGRHQGPGWFAAGRRRDGPDHWHDPWFRTLQMYLGAAEPGASLLVLVQGAAKEVDVLLPGAPWASSYRLLWDSAAERPPSGPDDCPRRRAGHGAAAVPAGVRRALAPG